MGRLLIVSNRLPVTVTLDGDAVKVERSMGGLATGLSGPHERTSGEWIGWPGAREGTTPEQKKTIQARFAELRLVPVALSAEELEGYYEGYSNGVVWPLFHYMLGHVTSDASDWESYRVVNERFAKITAERWKPGDLVWVHDYQLMLVPAFLRALIPEARIGFFLHIPFPSTAVFRGLPHGDEILRGLLGADLVGFHTASYLRHFAASLLRTLGIAIEVDRVAHRGRETRLGVFPMGVDARRYQKLSESGRVQTEVAKLRADPQMRILLGIDRLDYTKGIPRRILAFERLLQRRPELRERVRMIQIAVPSRANIRAYQETRQRMDTYVSRVNGTFGTATWTPVTCLHKAVPAAGVMALCRAADVVLVTPVRDGMNLVAKEFVASRSDEDGVLVLSELAGAAQELGEALMANPFDLDAVAEVYQTALEMPREERRRRMRAMRERVFAYDVHRWADEFVERLESTSAATVARDPEEALRKTLERARNAEHLELLLDYDGTLRSFELDPDAAAPDVELAELLRELALRPRTSVHLISGRARADLDRWFGDFAIGLHAEHGLWSRFPGEAWERARFAPLVHADRIAELLQNYAARVRGAFVEAKDVTLAFHWRAAEPSHGARQVNELRLHLMHVCGTSGAQVLPGDRVLEVRPAGLSKGNVVERVLARGPADALLVAIGDDRTDEDLFAALPKGSIAVRVGEGVSSASVRLEDSAHVRRFLREVLDAAESATSAP